MTRDRAIVIGGSIGGTLAALAASAFFSEVVVIEREALTDGPEPRKWVPQGRQAHALLDIGKGLMSEFIPDLDEQLRNAGCSEIDQCLHLPTMTPEGWRARAESTIMSFGFRRPLLEAIIRANLRRKPNCVVRVGTVKGLIADYAKHGIRGVRLADHTVVEGDLVIDASGRSSLSPKWLEELGYNGPEEKHVSCFMGYATQVVRVPEDVLGEDMAGIVTMPYPGRHRGGLMIPVDNGLHMITAAGMMRDYPPSDRDGFIEFLDSASSPILGQIARLCEPVSEVSGYRMDSSRLRCWEKLERRPRGFIVLGDAVASYNPVYGQGMTISAKGAVVLRDCLQETDDDNSLPERFQAEYAKFTEEAFNISAMADTFYENAQLTNVTPADPADYTYFGVLAQLATEDAEVGTSLLGAYASMQMDILQSAELREKAARWVESGRTPTVSDPTRVPRPVRPEPRLTHRLLRPAGRGAA